MNRSERARRPGGVVFLHAHPDDEDIFTGGTLAQLTAAGCPTTVLVATSGQLGPLPEGAAGTDIGPYREAETRRACRLLGVERVEFLGYRDSGMPGDAANQAPGAFAAADPDTEARRVAAVVAAQGAEALVLYDQGRHLRLFRPPAGPGVGARAARLAGLPTAYQATVDRGYLHVVEAHLVADACRSLPPAALGVPSVAVSTTVEVGDQPAAKRGRHRGPPLPGARPLPGPDHAGGLLCPGARLRVVPAGRAAGPARPHLRPPPASAGVVHRRVVTRTAPGPPAVPPRSQVAQLRTGDGGAGAGCSRPAEGPERGREPGAGLPLRPSLSSGGAPTLTGSDTDRRRHG